MTEFFKEFRNVYFCIELSITLSLLLYVRQLLFSKVHVMNFFLDFLAIIPMARAAHLFTAAFFFLVTLHEI